jgi:hypothetical protein
VVSSFLKELNFFKDRKIKGRAILDIAEVLKVEEI